MMPLEHRQQEVCESLGFLFANEILVCEHFLHWPEAQTLDSSQITSAIEKFFGMLAGHRKIFGHSSKELHHLSQVVIILVVVLTLSWLEEEITSHHLKDCAGKAPDICWSVIVGSNYNFRRTILSSLNFWRKMVVCPTSIAHVADLNLYIITDSWSSLEFFLFLCILSIFSFLISFLLFSIEKAVKLLFFFVTISILASCICSFRFFLVVYLRILFWLCTTNCYIINVNFF